jgi:hypothetical protein
MTGTTSSNSQFTRANLRDAFNPATHARYKKLCTIYDDMPEGNRKMLIDFAMIRWLTLGDFPTHTCLLS